MAVATIIALPTLVFFVLVQRRFIEGVRPARSKDNPPHSNGEVSASYADGGVRGPTVLWPHDPSVADRPFSPEG